MQPTQAVRIQRLELEQFRVYESLRLAIPSAGLRVVGRNGSGKSTLLEAIELLSTTRPRAGASDADLIAYESGNDLGVPPFARSICDVMRDDVLVKLEVFVQRTARRNMTKKQFRIADRPRRATDIVGLLPTVTFAPDDMDLVLGSPSIRRRFLDVLLSQVDRRYLRHLSRYAKIVSQRNGLLKEIAQGGAMVDDQFAYWDEQLVALGSYIVAARFNAVRAVSSIAATRFHEMSPSSGYLSAGYTSTIESTDSWWHGLERDGETLDVAQRIGPVFEDQLRKQRPAELARGATLVGPHRDDITLLLDDRPVARFGSRGQQRLVVLAIKLAELQYAESVLGVRPVLLLDDILSELDPDHRDALFTAVGREGQMFVTATEEQLVDRAELDDLELLTLRSPGEVGRIG
jgi:DNA replication and repair protein RecF